MKLPLSWLREHLATSSTPEQIAHTLTMLGIEVDAIANSTAAQADVVVVSKEGTEVTHLSAEPVFEISLTPNLIHVASVRGVARELAAAEKMPLLPYPSSIEESSSLKIDELIKVSVEDPESCPRYCCRVIDHVKVGPSPQWLKERIEASGLRSVNNVVDSTNYVMLEIGQPLHAFDLDKIAGGSIHVRKATPGETILTLDGQERTLSAEMLVIADARAPLAIAGVMGSLSSEVTNSTQTVLLEAAYFAPSQVRKTSKQCALQTAASYRFERGADREALHLALNRAAELIRTICQGEVAQEIYDSNPTPLIPPPITLRLERIQRLLGLTLGRNEIESLFQRLGLTLLKSDETTIIIRAPTYRHDLSNEIDLVEEVARLYGYQKLIGKKRSLWRRTELASSPAYLFETRIRHLLLKCHLQEVINCDLISQREADFVSADVGGSNAIHLLNPSSLDHSILRTSLLPGLLTTFKHNADHGVDQARLFEVGRIHLKHGDRFLEPSMAAILLTGRRALPFWGEKESPVDFYDLKGLIERLLIEMQVEDIHFTPSHFTNLHPGRQAHIVSGDLHLGVMGEVHPLILQKAGLTQPLYFAEINLDDMSQRSNGFKKMHPLPLYPASKRDWTLPLSKEQAIDGIFSLIKKIGSSLLESVSLVDIYQNEKWGSDLIHATFRFSYRDPHRTLSLKEIEKEHEMIIQTVLSGLGKPEEKS